MKKAAIQTKIASNVPFLHDFSLSQIFGNIDRMSFTVSFILLFLQIFGFFSIFWLPEVVAE